MGKGPVDVAKWPVPAATRELPLPPTRWIPASMGLSSRVRDAGFLLLLLLSVAWCWQPLMTVISRSLGSGEYAHYSHIILLPFVSAYLLHLKRDAIFEYVRPAFRTGLLATAVAATAIWLGRTSTITEGPEEGLALTILGLVMLWAGGFVLCYGLRAFRRGAGFPFALLVFMVPLPPLVLSSVIVFLQTASADVSELLFGLIRMPMFRDGFTFALPGLTIQIAQECSGIRSSLSLLICGLLMAHLLLRMAWTKVVLGLVIIPLAILKNAVRIVVLSWLAVHVDPSFITASAVHRNSGIPVFLTSLTILGGFVWLLRRWEVGKGQ